MKKIWLGCLLMIVTVLSACHREEIINTSKQVQEEDGKVTAADFVEYSTLDGMVEFNSEENFSIDSSKTDVVIYMTGELNADEFVDRMIDEDETSGDS